MRRVYHLLAIAVVTYLATSCLVQHPEYSGYDRAMSVDIGMTLDAVKDSLGIEPHYMKKKDESGQTIYAFPYRLCEIKRLPLFMKRNTGVEVEGDFVDLLVTVNENGVVTALETCTNCRLKDEKTTVVDFDGLIRGFTTMLTVTLPALLVFLSNE